MVSVVSASAVVSGAIDDAEEEEDVARVVSAEVVISGATDEEDTTSEVSTEQTCII